MEESSGIYYALITDIGGTNARLQLISFAKDSSTPNNEKLSNYSPKKYQSLIEIISDFLKEYENTPKFPTLAVIGIAGAPKDNIVEAANIPWKPTDGHEISKKFNIPKVKLINDFEAIGYSLLKMPEDKIVCLNKGNPIKGEFKAIIGPGSGLGMCQMYAAPCKKDEEPKYFVKATEGGHANFDPRDQLEWTWLQYLQENFPHVGPIISVERAFCGPSIPYMYAFFAELAGKNIQDIGKLTAEKIMSDGEKGVDEIAVQVFNFVLRLYGNAVGSFALRTLPFGGLYMVGNITNSILKHLTEKPDNEFMRNYWKKETVLLNCLKDVPLYIVTQKELGLLGAFVEATRMLE